MRRILFFALLFCCCLRLLAEEPVGTDTAFKGMLKVYIDCDFCDVDYMRENIRFIHYVRERKEAQVHVLVTRQNTGSGGEEFTMVFIGQHEFMGRNDTLVYMTAPDETDEAERLKESRTLKLGLMYYVARTPVGEQITIDYDKPGSTATEEDPWKNWVFEIGMRGWFNGEEVTKSSNISSSFDISKVLPEWKIDFGADASYSEQIFIIGEEKLLSVGRSQSANIKYVKSLSSHWSAGGFEGVRSSLYNNLRFEYHLAPAVEYNLFPYAQSTRRQLRFLYIIGYLYSYYRDTTIYNETEEGLFGHNLSVALQVNEKWGRVNFSVNGKNYFPDYTKNNLSVHTSLNIRIVKGLSFNISGGLSIVHDQFSLPKEGASEQEILLRQRELASQYDYWGSAGLNYTFGSIYNNIVNPRFGD